MTNPVDSEAERSSRTVTIHASDQLVSEGSVAARAYRVEFPTRQVRNDFANRWGLGKSYTGSTSGGCRLKHELPGLTIDRNFPLGLLISPGGVKRAERILRKMGVQAEVVWEPERLRTSPRREVLPTLAKVSRQVMDQIADSQRGLIEVGRNKERLNLVLAIIRLHREARCQILVASKKDGRFVADQLQKRGVEASFLASPQSAAPPRSVRVSCAPGANAEIFDLFIFWDASCATRPHCRDVMQLTIGHRVFGFVDVGWSASPDLTTKIWIESLVGPVLSSSVVGMAEPRRMATIPYRCRERVGKDASPLTRKRRLIWDNRNRNKVIADFATELHTGRAASSTAVKQVRKHLDNQAAQCIILVEKPEHARQLSGVLPGWDVVTYSPDAVEEIRETGGLRSRPILHSKKVIMTTPAANAIYGGGVQCHHNVAVWAGGGPRPSSCPIIQEIAVVVDVRDKGEPAMEKQATARVKSYRAQTCH